MNYFIRWLPQASQDLHEIRDYLDKEAPDAATEIVKTIIDSVDTLVSMPYRCKVDYDNPEYRCLVILKSYLAFYRVVGDIVEINYIRHASRDNKGLS